MKEHNRNIKAHLTHKSPVAAHAWKEGHWVEEAKLLKHSNFELTIWEKPAQPNLLQLSYIHLCSIISQGVYVHRLP